jgi:hypothetical protein
MAETIRQIQAQDEPVRCRTPSNRLHHPDRPLLRHLDEIDIFEVTTRGCYSTRSTTTRRFATKYNLVVRIGRARAAGIGTAINRIPSSNRPESSWSVRHDQIRRPRACLPAGAQWTTGGKDGRSRTVGQRLAQHGHSSWPSPAPSTSNSASTRVQAYSLISAVPTPAAGARLAIRPPAGEEHRTHHTP